MAVQRNVNLFILACNHNKQYCTSYIICQYREMWPTLHYMGTKLLRLHEAGSGAHRSKLPLRLQLRGFKISKLRLQLRELAKAAAS